MFYAARDIKRNFAVASPKGSKTFAWPPVVRRVRCAVLIVSAACLIVISSEGASAQARRLVCFEVSGIEGSLSGVTNAQQFLRNDLSLKNGSCDFAIIPPGSTARFQTFLQTENGFIFPIYRVRYGTTGQQMFAADGIFLASGWRVTQRCKFSAFRDECLAPRNCAVVDGLLLADGSRPYLAVPPECREQRLQ